MQPYDTTTSYKDSYSSGRSADRLSSDSLSDRLSKTGTTSRTRTHTSNKKKKPIMVTLVAALIGCLIAFILGFVISSFAMLDSRLESVAAKNAELQETIKQKDVEIGELNAAIDKKNESNIALGEQIQEHLKTIDGLKNNVQSLETDVHTIADAALNDSETPTPVATLASLSLSQQLLLFVVLLVIIIFIISVTCSIIASRTGEKIFKKSKKSKSDKKASKNEKIKEDEREKTEDEPSDEPISEDEEDEEDEKEELDSLADLGATREFSFDNAVHEAIDLLYHNNLEDNISDLGGFKFGITNFEEVLSDKAKGKSFGNAENGDFVAFMSTKSAVKKLYIIPRYMSLSDSSVALRGTTDLFDINDEADNVITHGTVKIKTIDSPAVFAFGDNGWAIESKGHITASGTRH
ncbi:MAG: hypothetical protein IJ316_01855 [Clostridia bacterium]|nr:hypothetical protein [Clostridia bacterium]